MSGSAYCAACRAFVPIVRHAAGKTIGAALGSMAGRAGRKSVAGTLALALLGLVLGHFVDEALQAVCGACQRPLRPQPRT